MAPDALATVVQPESLALATLVLTIFLFCTSLVTVLTRTWVRASDSCFGLDDGLMLAGLILYTVDCGVVARATFTGLGTPEVKLSPATIMEGMKFVVLWQVFYVTSLCCIKSAICVTLIRIATERFHRIIAISIIAVTCATSLIGFIGVLTTCQPVAANWDPARGHCASPIVITDLSYLVSASSILTDCSAATLPIAILWKAQMKTSLKLSVGVILGLGAIASVCTIVRMPYLKYYKEPTDFLLHLSNVILLSIIECGIGLIAGSLPMMRRLVKRWIGDGLQPNDLPLKSLKTFGQGRASRKTNRHQLQPERSHLESMTVVGEDNESVQLDGHPNRRNRFSGQTAYQLPNLTPSPNLWVGSNAEGHV